MLKQLAIVSWQCEKGHCLSLASLPAFKNLCIRAYFGVKVVQINKYVML